MKPFQFPEAQRALTAPEGMTKEECGDLWIYETPEGQCISCWRMSWRERLSALIFGRAWIWVWSGSTQPPISLLAKRQIFTTTNPGADRKSRFFSLGRFRGVM